MAIKASASITVSMERDILAIYRFYQIASSTSTPSKPTDAQGKTYVSSGTLPTGWSLVEPSYSGTSTNSLYFTDLTSFSDGNVSWTGVSKSSSYEAAKEAWNKANVAQNTADGKADTQDIMDAIEQVKQITDEERALIQKVSYWMQFQSDQGLVIGKESSEFHVQVTDTEIGFYQSGDKVAYISNNQLYITKSVVLQQMDIGTLAIDGGLGQWSWKVHSVNGANNLYLKWLG